MLTDPSTYHTIILCSRCLFFNCKHTLLYPTIHPFPFKFYIRFNCPVPTIYLAKVQLTTAFGDLSWPSSLPYQLSLQAFPPQTRHVASLSFILRPQLNRNHYHRNTFLAWSSCGHDRTRYNINAFPM